MCGRVWVFELPLKSQKLAILVFFFFFRELCFIFIQLTHYEQNFGWIKSSSACPIFSYPLLFNERLLALLSAKDVNKHEAAITLVLLNARRSNTLCFWSLWWVEKVRERSVCFFLRFYELKQNESHETKHWNGNSFLWRLLVIWWFCRCILSLCTLWSLASSNETRQRNRTKIRPTNVGPREWKRRGPLHSFHTVNLKYLRLKPQLMV